MESIDSCLLVFKSEYKSAILLEHGLFKRFYVYLRGMWAAKKYKFIIHLDEKISVSLVKMYGFWKIHYYAVYAEEFSIPSDFHTGV